MSDITEVTGAEDHEIDSLLRYFTESLHIDKLTLDECCIQQPTLFEHVARALAYRTSLRDEAKRNLAETEASVDAEIRQVEKDQKITEKRVATLVSVEPKVIGAQKKLIDYSYVVNRLSALKEAYEHRRAMLKELVGLHSSGFWGDVSDQKSYRDARGRQQHHSREKIKEQRELVESIQERRRASFDD